MLTVSSFPTPVLIGAPLTLTTPAESPKSTYVEWIESPKHSDVTLSWNYLAPSLE